MFLFMIVGGLVAVDIVFLIPITAASNSRLRREYEKIEGDEVSVLYIWLSNNYLCILLCM